MNPADILTQLKAGSLVSRPTVVAMAEELVKQGDWRASAYAARDIINKIDDDLTALLLGTYSDGGSVTVMEQLQRMATDAQLFRTLLNPMLHSMVVVEREDIGFDGYEPEEIREHLTESIDRSKS